MGYNSPRFALQRVKQQITRVVSSRSRSALARGFAAASQFASLPRPDALGTGASRSVWLALFASPACAAVMPRLGRVTRMYLSFHRPKVDMRRRSVILKKQEGGQITAWRRQASFQGLCHLRMEIASGIFSTFHVSFLTALSFQVFDSVAAKEIRTSGS